MYSKDPREAYHPAQKMWSPKTPSNSNKALKTAKSASSSAEQAGRASKMRYHGGSGRPAEVIALRCSLGSSSVHQCMYGCVRAAHKAPKDVGVVRGGADGGKIGKMAGGRARTARGRKRPRELRRNRRELHHTYERRPRARRRRARRRGAGAGSRRARSLLRRSSQVLLCRGRCIECLLIKIGNNSGMAMPMPGARVRAAGAGATPCPRKSVARSCEYTSFQQ